jgi:dTMP kinase
MKRRFFSFEGVEGSGKSTQLRLLAGHLERQGLETVALREPGGVTISEAIRAILLDPAHKAMCTETELLLYAASRAQLIEERISPALAQGQVVLCDRYADSTTAYQGAGRGVDMAMIEQLHELATGGLWPVRTFLLDLSVEEGLERARARGRADRIEQESIDFHRRVRDAYLALAHLHPERFVVLDAAQQVEALHAEVAAVADEVLGLNGL